MADLAPGNDPLAAAEAAAAAAAAAGVGGGAGGVPPVGGGPPPPLVLPLASPSPISMAIWDKVAEAERAEFSNSEMRNYQLVVNGNNASPGALVLMVSTGAFEPKCFLTARMNSARAIPQIELIHSVGNYVVALGQADDLHGHSFAFVGDQVGDQLPSTYLEPETGGILSAFTMSNVGVPTEAVINAHYAQVNPSVFLPSDTAGVATDLMEVCMIPLMWAPYFIGGGTPKQTLDKIELLLATVPGGQRQAYESIHQWGRYACVAAGQLGAELNQSSISTEWRDFPRGIAYNAWAEGRFRAVYRMAARHPAAAAAPIIDQSQRMAEAIVIGMKGASAAEKEKKEKYAPYERSKILAACGLHEDEWTSVPAIYDKITLDGRTRTAVRNALEQEYRETSLRGEFPASVFLSTQLVKDVKDVNFGWQGVLAFDGCHRGISPFAVPHHSMEAAQRLRAVEEEADSVTTTTIADVRAARSKPPPCPTGYYDLLQMLSMYIKLLMMLFGSMCDHMIHATSIFYLLRDQMATFEHIDGKQVASILWIIFRDARAYFSAGHDVMGEPPVSHLDWAIGALRGGMVPQVIGIPRQLLEGNSATTGGQPSPRQGTASGGTRNQQGPQGPNTNVHTKIEAATAEARRRDPDLNYKKVMETAPQPKPRITNVQLQRGGCFDYLFFGKCSNARCTFKHDGEVDEAKIDGVIAKMRPGLEKFVELH